MAAHDDDRKIPPATTATGGAKEKVRKKSACRGLLSYSYCDCKNMDGRGKNHHVVHAITRKDTLRLILALHEIVQGMLAA